jgi:hypothetical protein
LNQLSKRIIHHKMENDIIYQQTSNNEKLVFFQIQFRQLTDMLGTKTMEKLLEDLNVMKLSEVII